MIILAKQSEPQGSLICGWELRTLIQGIMNNVARIVFAETFRMKTHALTWM